METSSVILPASSRVVIVNSELVRLDAYWWVAARSIYTSYYKSAQLDDETLLEYEKIFSQVRKALLPGILSRVRNPRQEKALLRRVDPLEGVLVQHLYHDQYITYNVGYTQEYCLPFIKKEGLSRFACFYNRSRFVYGCFRMWVFGHESTTDFSKPFFLGFLEFHAVLSEARFKGDDSLEDQVSLYQLEDGKYGTRVEGMNVILQLTHGTSPTTPTDLSWKIKISEEGYKLCHWKAIRILVDLEAFVQWSESLCLQDLRRGGPWMLEVD